MYIDSLRKIFAIYHIQLVHVYFVQILVVCVCDIGSDLNVALATVHNSIVWSLQSQIFQLST